MRSHTEPPRPVIPAPIIAVLSEVLPEIATHSELDRLFMHAGAPGDPPEGNKQAKVQEWLRRTSRDTTVNPLEVVGRLVEPILEADCTESGIGEYRAERKRKVESALARCNLHYVIGGSIAEAVGNASKSLAELIRGRDLAALEQEFSRAIRNVESSPREAVSAASNIVESVCKVYIQDEKIELPAKQDLPGVWGVVRKHLGFDPSAVEDRDLKEILSGLLALVNGLGALRTHASSAHGEGRKHYKLEARHARLAVNAAHTIVLFIMESWAKKQQP